MKRFHVHVRVADLAESIRFYSALFAGEPTVVKDDYAKWMLDDPRVNFAISHRGAAPGLDHLGVQVENESELAEMHKRLSTAALPVDPQIGRHAAMHAPTSIGRSIRKVSPGRHTRRSARSQPSVNPGTGRRLSRTPTALLAAPRRAASRSACQ